MNERIQKLAEQATTVIEANEFSGEGWIFNKEKFAELIIEECMSNLHLNGYDDAMNQIKNHFGVNIMLKDRRVLLEQEIVKAHDEAAKLYLHIVTHDGDIYSKEYASIKDKIMNLEFDLNIVNQLIAQGHK
jgi:hypothetical protein